MLLIRSAHERGRTRLSWLESFHTFSFNHYFDPRFQGYGALRVLNEDRVAPGGGFPTHPHREMEILTYVLEGVLEHRDSTGTLSRLEAGQVQRMSAGTGILHSERNPSQEEPVHFLQIWILPERRGLPPSYQQGSFLPASQPGTWLTVAEREGREGALLLHQDARVLLCHLPPSVQAGYPLEPFRRAWLQVAKGRLLLNRQALEAGDGAALAEEHILLEGIQDAEVLLFDLPGANSGGAEGAGVR